MNQDGFNKATVEYVKTVNTSLEILSIRIDNLEKLIEDHIKMHESNKK